ncbi:NADH/ubiquinone/plastoquinone (complex I) [bacterium]|nr:NADH/ubiquinone/plastoquinone (complex I) [bacterium]MBU1064776.1 NADH/ubiquinone/plastoquinone (complex I) [bacterium]MBU1633237.1 NADH/ubiquinone/plastoquinone (complex I) [bacterium]MBU1874184.1 NADH/ubiquinone/plastoquinone (complex I) [bacterium]
MILPFLIIIPLLAAFLITLISGEKDNWAIVLSVLAEMSLLTLALFSFFTTGYDTFVYEMSGWKIPLTICLVQDALSGFMLVIVNLIALTSLMFSISYIRQYSSPWKYYALFMLLITGMNGVIATGDIFNLFVFMEIALFAAYALVAFGAKAEEYEAAFKYAVMGSISSTLILLGIGILYASTSTLTMAHIAAELQTKDPQVTYWVAAVFLVGFGLKSAVMPFHAWLPDAHSSAPAPISSMLSGVLIKALGIYAIIRIFFNIFGAPPVFLMIFMVLGSISIIVASYLALGQWDLKRLLAYSSISQIGFILLGLGIGTKLAILGAVFHILNHAIFKSLLFYNAGSVEMALGTRDLRKMGNLRGALPVTTSTSMIASLSVAGLPPFNGFFSKLIIIIAAVQSQHIIYAIIAVIGSLLTLAYFMKVQRYGFHGETVINEIKKPVSLGMKSAMIILAVLCVVVSILIIPGIREITLDPVVSVIISKTGYIQAVIGR